MNHAVAKTLERTAQRFAWRGAMPVADNDHGHNPLCNCWRCEHGIPRTPRCHCGRTHCSCSGDAA